MADFDKAFRKVMSLEGIDSFFEPDGDNPVLLCSECFKDEGLRIDAQGSGFDSAEQCSNCKSTTGKKLTLQMIHGLCYLFFVRGTIHKTKYGGSPTVQFNEYQHGTSELEVSPWLKKDIALLEEARKIGFFKYGPPQWMLGDNEPLQALQVSKKRNGVIRRILETYPEKIWTVSDPFYRIRVNLKETTNFNQFDSSPDEHLGKNRFDSKSFPVMYGSPDLQLCIHECRVTVEDDLYVAKLKPKHDLKLLDLTELIDEDNTEFESLDMAIYLLFLAGKHSYRICRALAIAAKENGFDGLIYPSYFSYVRRGAIPFETTFGISIRKRDMYKSYAKELAVPNIALFGRPIREGKVEVECINRVLINRVQYDVTFGPCNH